MPGALYRLDKLLAANTAHPGVPALLLVVQGVTPRRTYL